MLGVSTGGRISELLSLQIGNVYQNRAAVTDLLYDKSIRQGRRSLKSRAGQQRRQAGNRRSRCVAPGNNTETPKTTVRYSPRVINREPSPYIVKTAHQMLKKAFELAGLNGKIATHSLRKSFAQRVYEQSNDIYLVKELLGHKKRQHNTAVFGCPTMLMPVMR